MPCQVGRVTHLDPLGLSAPLRLGRTAPTLLPVRPRPEAGELLSSWLFRLGQANTQKLHSLCRHLFGDRHIWNRDIDRLAGPEVLAALERATGVSASVLAGHTLPALEGRVFARHNAHGSTAWVLPLGVYHRKRRRPGLQYCPACLCERPVFLVAWRLSLSVVCPRHGCALLEVCPNCRLPVAPHRVDIAAHLSKSLPTRFPHTRCFHCGLNLSTVPVHPAQEPVVAWQRDLHAAIFETGRMTVPGVGEVPVLDYLAVARKWLTLLTFGRRAERLRALVEFPIALELGRLGRSFDDLEVQVREVAVRYLVTLFEGWPERPVQWSRAARIRRTTLLEDMWMVPEWYLQALRPLEHVNPRTPLSTRLSPEELERRASAGDQFYAILAAYGRGQSLRQIAAFHQIKPRKVRSLVSRYNRSTPR